MQRLRQSLAILICATLLAGVPVREAYAIPLLDQALRILALPLTLLLGASGKLEGVLMVINTKLPIMIKTVELKQREKLSVAADENRRKIEELRLQSRTARDFAPDITHNACILQTGGQDNATVEVKAFKAGQTLGNDFAVLRNRGTVLGTGVRGRPAALNVARGNREEFKDNVCKYAGPNEAAAYEAAGCGPKAEAQNNPYRGANTTAVTLTNTGAFDETRHFVAAMDFCYAMTGNLPLPYAQGRALTESIDNITQFNLAMSDYATQDIAAFNCLSPVFRKLPLDTKFARSDPLYQRFNETLVAGTQNAGDTSANADEARSLANVDKRARSFLLDQNAGGYTEIDPKQKKVGEISADAAKQLIRGQMVSMEQQQEAEYIYKWYSTQYTSTIDAPGKTMKPVNIYQTRLYNVQLMWHQYEQLERDVLMEAIQLARLTRQAQRGPSAETPTGSN